VPEEALPLMKVAIVSRAISVFALQPKLPINKNRHAGITWAENNNKSFWLVIILREGLQTIVGQPFPL